MLRKRFRGIAAVAVLFRVRSWCRAREAVFQIAIGTNYCRRRKEGRRVREITKEIERG